MFLIRPAIKGFFMNNIKYQALELIVSVAVSFFLGISFSFAIDYLFPLNDFRPILTVLLTFASLVTIRLVMKNKSR